MTNDSHISIIRLGGSLISPEPGRVAVDFLRSFRDEVITHVALGHKFAIICGGGKTCRTYQEDAKAIDPDIVTHDDMDWIGIATIGLNAEVVRSIFPKDLVHGSVVTNLKDASGCTEPVIIIGAEEIGHSSNYDAVEIARILKAEDIINLSNIEYVYNSDPRTNPDAIKYEKVSWDEYLTFIPDEWTPGLSSPFDPVSSRRAQELGLSVVFMKGDNLDNFRNYLDGKSFIGSIISS